MYLYFIPNVAVMPPLKGVSCAQLVMLIIMEPYVDSLTLASDVKTDPLARLTLPPPISGPLTPPTSPLPSTIADGPLPMV